MGGSFPHQAGFVKKLSGNIEPILDIIPLFIIKYIRDFIGIVHLPRTIAPLLLVGS